MYDQDENELSLLRHRLKVALRRLDNKDLEVRVIALIRDPSRSGAAPACTDVPGFDD